MASRFFKGTGNPLIIGFDPSRRFRPAALSLSASVGLPQPMVKQSAHRCRKRAEQRSAVCFPKLNFARPRYQIVERPPLGGEDPGDMVFLGFIRLNLNERLLSCLQPRKPVWSELN